MKYALIQAHRGQFAVSLMCRLLEVSCSGYYAAEKRGVGKRSIARERLRLHVRAAFRKSRGRYGSPRVHQELRSEGIRTGRRQVEQVMREEGLHARARRRFVRTTDSSHAQRIHPNLLERRFAVEENREMDRVWVGDITYLPTREGWLYLAVLLDLASRRLVGWAVRDSLEADLTLEALERALWSRRPCAGLIHHSDRGGQYASGEYQARLCAHGIRSSMSKKGDCWDNAVAESFFATLEKELIDGADWQTHAEARDAVVRFTDVWYNHQRRHSSLGYQSPAAYERQLALTSKAA